MSDQFTIRKMANPLRRDVFIKLLRPITLQARPHVRTFLRSEAERNEVDLTRIEFKKDHVYIQALLKTRTVLRGRK